MVLTRKEELILSGLFPGTRRFSMLERRELRCRLDARADVLAVLMHAFAILGSFRVIAAALTHVYCFSLGYIL